MSNAKMTQDSVIKSISFSQHEILHNIMHLYNRGRGFELDLTYSKGNFYGDFRVNGEGITIPQPRHKLDVNPQTDEVIKIDAWGALPFDDASIKSIIFDPPFDIKDDNSVKAKDPKHSYASKRFGYYYSQEEMLKSYLHWLQEINRILKKEGLLIVKCQPQQKYPCLISSQNYIWLIAESLGLTLIDTFVSLKKTKMLAPQRQAHSMRYESYFLVLKKDLTTKTRYFTGFKEEVTDTILQNFKHNNEAQSKFLRNIDTTLTNRIKKRQTTKDLSAVQGTIKKLHRKGLSNRQIAEALNISEFKVRYWLKRRRKKKEG